MPVRQEGRMLMSLDGIAMRALAHSLEDTINGGRDRKSVV